MELSPLARERIAKLGELSDAEKKDLKFSEKLTSLLSDYFTDRINLNELWTELKNTQEENKEFMIKETQTRLLHAITLGGNTVDFERCIKGVLSCETLKSPNRYNQLELNLNAIEDLRKQYNQEKDTAFHSMKEQIQGQVRKAAQQAARKAGNNGMSIDIEGSIQASVRSSPQWRNFVLTHEKKFSQQFEDYLNKIEALL